MKLLYAKSKGVMKMLATKNMERNSSSYFAEKTKKKCNLNDKIIKEIKSISEKYPIQKIILFGSRARGDNKPTSDIDIAVDVLPGFKSEGIFASEIEDLDTLLKFDIVFLHEIRNKNLITNIDEEGIIIYERL